MIPNAFARSRQEDTTSRIVSMIESAPDFESLKYGATDRAKSKSRELSCSSMASDRRVESGEGLMSKAGESRQPFASRRKP